MVGLTAWCVPISNSECTTAGSSRMPADVSDRLGPARNVYKLPPTPAKFPRLHRGLRPIQPPSPLPSPSLQHASRSPLSHYGVHPHLESLSLPGSCARPLQCMGGYQSPVPREPGVPLVRPPQDGRPSLLRRRQRWTNHPHREPPIFLQSCHGSFHSLCTSVELPCSINLGPDSRSPFISCLCSAGS